MSKELLKRVRDTLHELEETHYDLYWDIQAELDKPEQEPVAKITSIHADGENLPVVITAIVLSEAVNIWDLPIKNNDLLYLAPPNREPPQTAREMYQRGYAAAERDLKREPLSREEYMKCFTDTYHSDNPITDFVKAIEKAHGIGETK